MIMKMMMMMMKLIIFELCDGEKEDDDNDDCDNDCSQHVLIIIKKIGQEQRDSEQLTPFRIVTTEQTFGRFHFWAMP